MSALRTRYANPQNQRKTKKSVETLFFVFVDFFCGSDTMATLRPAGLFY